ncbi:hypothetical protein B296_00020844 [Ensete ventricosum]|uniref:NPH3 domain-containing protein n=1 Tax=Ensete ventricosum TaxID=4639 RepID=A0A426Z7P5_ENSVE|nr:hypothetical protein B296_00020844 [Ensete ventricosum]
MSASPPRPSPNRSSGPTPPPLPVHEDHHHHHPTPDHPSWLDDAGIQDLDHFAKTLTVMKAKGVRTELLSAILSHYSSSWLPELSGRAACDPSPESPTAAWLKKRLLIETLASILPTEKRSVSCDFLLTLLRTASMVGAAASCVRELEARAAAQLDEASLEELMIPAFSHTCGTLLDVGLVLRLVRRFAGNNDDGGAAARSGAALERVAKLVDSYLAEAALDAGLTVAEFEKLASSLPVHARAMDDGLYRAVDTFIKPASVCDVSLRCTVFNWRCFPVQIACLFQKRGDVLALPGMQTTLGLQQQGGIRGLPSLNHPFLDILIHHQPVLNRDKRSQQGFHLHLVIWFDHSTSSWFREGHRPPHRVAFANLLGPRFVPLSLRGASSLVPVVCTPRSDTPAVLVSMTFNCVTASGVGISTIPPAHPSTSKQEKKTLCRLIDARKLSAEASLHAAQNERLPVRSVIQVLFSEHTKLRRLTEQWGGSFDGPRSPNPEAAAARCPSKREVLLHQQEIRGLRDDVARLRVHCQGLQAQIDTLASSEKKKRGFFRWSSFLLFRTTDDDAAEKAEDSETGAGRPMPMRASKRSVPQASKWRNSLS